MENEKDDLTTSAEPAGGTQSSAEEPEFEVGSAAGNFDTHDPRKGSSAVEFEGKDEEPEFEVGSAAGNFDTHDPRKGSSAVEFDGESEEK